MRTPNEIGNDLESRAKKVLDGTRVKQSGGGKFYKSDVKTGGKFIWSCKATTTPYLKVTGELIREASRAARGVIGTGDNYTGGMIVEVEGEACVLLKLEDFAELLTAAPGELQHIGASKAAERLAAARKGL